MNKNRNIDVKPSSSWLLKRFYLLLAICFTTLLALLISMISPTPASAADFGAMYYYGNTGLINVSSGWAFSMGLETSQNFSSPSSITIEFPDDEDGLWCRSAGMLSVYGISSTPVDVTGSSWAIDLALPGTLSANCTQGAGPGSWDTITINGISALSSGVTYGFEVNGNSGVLGTASVAGGHRVDITLDDGVVNDTASFLLPLSTSHSVTISAIILPLPECNINADCTYPLEICDGLKQCEVCTVDAQCNFGDVCVAGACTRDLSCNTNMDCLYGDEVCGPSNLCQQCTANSQCNSGDRCVNGSCEPIPPAECTGNYNCNYPYEICSAGNCVPCSSSGQCTGADQCTNNVCTAPPPFQCSQNSQCDYPDEICLPTGVCTSCSTDWQCDFDEACVEGRCTERYECLSNNDCRFPDEVCSLNNVCTSCTLDAECGQGNICSAGACIAEPPAACTINSQCNYPDEVCANGDCLQCIVDQDCNSEDICVEGRCEPFPPAECTVNDHCDYPDLVCVEESCQQCTDDDQCEVGDECKSGKCVEEEPPVIIDDGDEQQPDGFIPVASTLLSNISDSIELVMNNIADQISNMSFNGPMATTVSLVTAVTVSMGMLNLALMDTPILFTRGILGLLTLVGIRLRGQPYGFVYNAISKEPLSNAMVRIFAAPTSDDAEEKEKLVETSVTDAFGVFNASLKPGRYRMKVSKSGFDFPSKIVVSLSDYPIDRIYHGDPFELNEEGEIYYSIPVDPYRQSLFLKFFAILRERFSVFLKFFQIVLVTFGGGLSVYLFISEPGIVNAVILLLYIPGILFTLYSFRNTEARYGTVRDNQGHPLGGITLGLFDEKENRLLTKRVTDLNGRYRFVAPKGEYSITLIDDTYELITENKIHLKSSKSDDYIVVVSDVTL